MARAYSLLAYVAVLPALLYLWWRGRKDPDYRLRWRERFGLLDIGAGQRGGVVLHCASVGEVLAARALTDRLLADPRYAPLVLTCSTPAGSRMIRQLYGSRVHHCYFPLDLPGATRRFLSALQPRLVLLLERELWPNQLRQAQQMGVPVALVNARLSVRSAAGYQRWRRLMGPALASLRLVCAEDATAAGRLAELGVPASRLKVTGNIKSDLRLDPALLERIAAARQLVGGRPVLTAGSTHAGEDEALLAAFEEQLALFPRTLLVLVPRHPERFAAVAQLLAHSGLRFARHSLGQAATADTQVVLGDTMGELLLWYGVADACFVGGSLITRGGHNPLEALCQGKPVISGPHTHNFAQLYAAMQEAGALLPAADASAVFGQFRALLQDREAIARHAARGQALYRRLAGATERTMAELEPFVAHAATARHAPPLVQRSGHTTIWADAQCFDSADPRLFDPAWWQRQQGSSSQGAGRGRIHHVADARRSYLLRHYYRGGLMARLSRDLFLAQPMAQTRAMREFELLRELRARGLAVPRACAARHCRHGPCYRADILVERIPGATDVAELLHRQRALAAPEWQTIGRAVRELHDEQVFHSDLNCHNLMLDVTGRAWIVDFDKCGFRPGDAWKRDNLDRLLRSLRKELRLDPALHWSEHDWAHFLSGYRDQPEPDRTTT